MSAFTSRVSAVSQLPVSWYFDEKLFELEQKLLFEAGPGYVGHALMVPEKGNCRSREWLDHARLLHRGEQGVHQLSSICRQRQAIRLEGSGSSAHAYMSAPCSAGLAAWRAGSSACPDEGRAQ